jgi:class 3 adenylate cyclase
MNAIFDLFDGRLEIVEDDETGQPVRFLRVASLRGRKYLLHQTRLTLSTGGTSFEESKPIISMIPPPSTEYELQAGERRLAAIMFTDMVGYTALTQSDEHRALEILRNHNRIIRPVFPRFNGREIKDMGDSFMVEFDSAFDATSCAIEIQRILHDYNSSTGAESRISVRIGVLLGDVVHSRGDVLGDAVNLASRIQPLAEPEGVCVSQQVYDQVRNKLAYQFARLESRELKNVQYPIDIYKIVLPWEGHPS